MRINLLLNGEEMRSGTVNIDPLATPGDGKVRGSLTNLDEHVDDAEADEIIALNIVDYLSSPEVVTAIKHWVGKLRHGGKIVISGTDSREVMRAYLSQRLTNPEFNALIHGRQIAPYDFKKSTLTLQMVADILQSFGLNILKKKMVDLEYLVEAERP